MKKTKTTYREAIEKLRETHADKIEEIFLKMYSIATTAEEDKDAVNAGKVCASLLGVPRPALEKQPTKPPATPTESKRPEPTAEEWKLIEERLKS